MPGAAAVLRHELIGLAGVFERNVYLVKRYIWWDVAFFLWTVANTLTIVFIAKGIEATGGQIDVDRVTTTRPVGAVVWAYLGIIFEILTETVAGERWEGTIEYTFMAPLSRPIHGLGMGAFAIVYGVIRAVLLFGVVALFFDLDLSQANFVAALVVLLVASISFIGIGMMTAVLPLISPEKGTQLGFIAQGLLAGRLRRLLPGRGAPAVDAVDLGHLAGHLRAGRDARRDHRRGGPGRDGGRALAAGRDRYVSVPLGLEGSAAASAMRNATAS